MHILRLQHPVFDYNGWKQAFDSDPIGRERSGVRQYRIMRPIDDDKLVMVDLEFDTLAQAEAALAALRVLWGQVEGTLIQDTHARIVEVAESKAY